jgi:hypothetical protein
MRLPTCGSDPYTHTRDTSVMDKKQKQAEVDRLAAWCLAILREIHAIQPNPLGTAFEDAISEAQKRVDLRGLRAVTKDLEEWVGTLDDASRKKVNAGLSSEFGRSLDESAAEDQAALDRIVQRGKINNDEEYRLVLKRVEEIYDDSAFEAEVDRLNKLLAGSHKHPS